MLTFLHERCPFLFHEQASSAEFSDYRSAAESLSTHEHTSENYEERRDDVNEDNDRLKPIDHIKTNLLIGILNIGEKGINNLNNRKHSDSAHGSHYSHDSSYMSSNPDERGSLSESMRHLSILDLTQKGWRKFAKSSGYNSEASSFRNSDFSGAESSRIRSFKSETKLDRLNRIRDKRNNHKHSGF